jgi:hypothetical protein
VFDTTISATMPAARNAHCAEWPAIVSGGVVVGYVIGPDRKRVAGASVMFGDGPVALPDIAQVTDAKGAFALAAPANGTYRLVINAPGFLPVERNIEVTGQSTSSIEISVGES